MPSIFSIPPIESYTIQLDKLTQEAHCTTAVAAKLQQSGLFTSPEVWIFDSPFHPSTTQLPSRQNLDEREG